jgi:dihydroorotate dehydrogenase
MALNALSFGLRPAPLRRFAARRFERGDFGDLTRFGLRFANPVGLAAGFDKNGRVHREMAALGFGFVEVGTVTHRAQPGNPQPRLFRLPLDRALINRQGFNNEGAEALARGLAGRARDCVLGINIGKSRVVDIEQATEDYLASFRLVHPHADYITINVSSPNTPGLRELQRADRLAALLGELQTCNHQLSEQSSLAPLPLLVKVAPDLNDGELELIVDVARRARFAGIIATNTTTSRAGLRTPSSTVEACGEGGLSGAPLRERSTRMIATLRRLTRGSMQIVGVGGVFTAADAWEKICAGASLVQIYTGLVYQGVGIARDINDGLKHLLDKHGFRALDEAVGCRSELLAA